MLACSRSDDARCDLSANETPASADDTTVVGLAARDRLIVAIGFPLLGVLGGWLLKLVAVWVQQADGVPLPGRFRFVAELATMEPYATVGSLVLGGIVGGVIAIVTIDEDLTVAIGQEHLRLGRGDDGREIPRSAISALFKDGGDLVVLGTQGEELAREPCDHGSRLAGALTAKGYPWMPVDPHADRYRRWVPDLPGLPEGADALLRARTEALEGEDTDDARQLRDELAGLGVVVRDEGTRQYWRTIGN